MAEKKKGIHKIIMYKLDTLQECINNEVKPKLDEIQKEVSLSNIDTAKNTANIKWLIWAVRAAIVGIIASSFFIYKNFSINKCVAQEKIQIERSKK